MLTFPKTSTDGLVRLGDVFDRFLPIAALFRPEISTQKLANLLAEIRDGAPMRRQQFLRSGT